MNIEEIRKKYNNGYCPTEQFLKLRSDVVMYISETYGMSMVQAGIIESYVYAEKHSFMNDYFAIVDEVAEMVENVLNCEA